MSVDFYTEVASDAVALIEEFGRETKLQKLSAVAANAAKPWKGPGVPTVLSEVTLFAAFVPATDYNLGEMVVSKEMLARVDEVLIVGPNAADLRQFNTVLDAGVRWRIEWVQVLKPANLVLLYVIGACR